MSNASRPVHIAVDTDRLAAPAASRAAARTSRPGARRWPGLAACAGALWIAAAGPALAFGGVAGLGECATFTTCTATAGSSTNATVQYTFTSIAGTYPLPGALVPGVNTFQDLDGVETAAPVRAAVGVLCANCASDNPFHSAAVARAQSDFGVNRASADTSFGAAGTHVRMFGQTVLGSASVQILTVAGAASGWRDVWRFNADGRFSATIALDGRSAAASANALFPDTYTYAAASPLGDWFYDFKVWDVTNLSVLEAFELGGPTLVTQVRERTGNGEARSSFASSLTLDFDFVGGVSYVVTAELGANARNGRDIDLYHTARLTDVALSGGATLNALSGHDYFAAVAPPVPEPGTAGLLLAGLACLGLWSRRRTRRAT